MSNSGSNFFAFLLGLLVGGIVGIFYAPERGENTRHQFTYQLNKYLERTRGLLQDMVKSGVHLENKAREESEHIINSTKEKAKSLLHDVDSIMGKIKNEGKAK